MSDRRFQIPDFQISNPESGDGNRRTWHQAIHLSGE
jgi:hypothetical protein